MTRTLTSVPTSSSTCISHLLRCCSLSRDRLTNNVYRRLSTRSPAGMDFPVGLSHLVAEEPVVNIGRGSAVYPLGASASSQRSVPSLRFEDCEMVVEEGQAWVVVGTSGVGKDVLLQVGRSYRHGCFVVLTSVLPPPLSPRGTVVVAGPYQDSPVPASTGRPIPFLDPPTHSIGLLQTRLACLLLTPTKVPDRFCRLLGTVRRGVG